MLTLRVAYTRLRRAARRFAAARRGNVALTFAVASIPIIGFAGAAVDYSRANAMKADMQSALDSAALMVSKNAVTMTSAQIQTAAQNAFQAVFTNVDANNVKVTASYANTNGSSVTMTASADMATDFVGILGYKTVTITGASISKWGSTRLRVALVLDNTGSMAQDGKMTALKTATANLLTQLQGAVTNDGDVYVSVIPFSKDVNVGTTNVAADWLDWTDWDSKNGTNVKTCTGSGSNKTCTTTWTPAAHSAWNGCVTDRGNSSGPSSANYDQNVTAPNIAKTDSLFSAEQYSYCTLAMAGLSYDWVTMTSLVNQMTPNGSTNQPIGLVWGWQSLAGGGPFTVPAEDPNYTYQKAIILLSDGLNTQDRWYGNGSNPSTQVDSRMVNASGNGTCANIKAAGITIYAIQVNTGGDPTSTLLQNCASDQSKFFLLTSANQIVATFNSIGTNLTKLRIAQ
jgi:Flp pilus assembly protein TadG